MNITTVKRKKRIFANPKFYYILAILLFICAIVVHPWDHQYKNFILKHRFLDTPTLGTFLGLIKVFGNGGIAAILALLFAAYGYRKLAYRIAISLIIMGIMVNVLKPIVGRERPNNRNDHSFPSGDTATAAAFFPSMAAESNFFIPGTIVLAPAVGFLRTYDNWHWLSDVITGLGVGFLAMGLALLFCEKKKNFLYKLIYCRFKPRHYAVISLIVLLACFIPELIKGGGKYLIFTAFYAPALYVWLMAVNTPFFFKNRSSKCKPIYKPVNHLKHFFVTGLNKEQTTDALINKLITIAALLLAVMLITFSWMRNLSHLTQACSGIGIGILILLLAVYKNKEKGNYKRIRPIIYSGICVLLFFTLVSLLPAYIRYLSS